MCYHEGRRGLTDSEEVTMEEGREIIIAENKERNNDGNTATLKENDTVEIPTISPVSSLTHVVFLSPAL